VSEQIHACTVVKKYLIAGGRSNMPITATVRSRSDSLRQEIDVDGRHVLITDEPASLGGTDSAPTPYELLPAAIASCVVTTLRLYARRKGWELGDVAVDVVLESQAPQPQRCRISLKLPDDLTDEQRARLERVADACAVHRTLERGVVFEHGERWR
jgi:putative redox protein